MWTIGQGWERPQFQGWESPELYAMVCRATIANHNRRRRYFVTPANNRWQ